MLLPDTREGLLAMPRMTRISNLPASTHRRYGGRIFPQFLTREQNSYASTELSCQEDPRPNRTREEGRPGLRLYPEVEAKSQGCRSDGSNATVLFVKSVFAAGMPDSQHGDKVDGQIFSCPDTSFAINVMLRDGMYQIIKDGQHGFEFIC